MSTTIDAKLEASRKELLDIGLRNPLINFTTRNNKIEIVDEISENIYNILVSSTKTIRFLPLPESLIKEDSELRNIFSDETDWSKLFGKDLEENDLNGNSRHTDNFLQTKLDSSSLQLRLLKLNTTANSFIEEQGFNALYLSLGFLHWFESDSSENIRKAPLILIPVKLDRSSAQERFKLNYSGEEIGLNLSLYEKLKAEFNIELPDFDDEEIGVSKYYKLVREKIKNQKRWNVVENEIVLSFFSFGKLRMYKDLDNNVWPENSKPTFHPIIRALLNDGFKNDSIPDIPDDSNIDSLIDLRNQYLILDADSSQTIAIEEAKNGKNLVIQGPPGTGKSQTITNLIAEAIGQNKKVLFVAEKMAALEVVKRRLDNIGLGDAVLELHSHKANKRSILEELKRTTQLDRPIVDKDANDIETLELIREKLNDYCAAINKPILNTSVSPINAIGEIISIRNKYEDLNTFDFAAMNSWTNSDFKKNKFRVYELYRRLSSMIHPKKNIYWGSNLSLFLPQDENILLQLINEVLDGYNNFKESFEKILFAIGLSNSLTISSSKILLDLLSSIKDKPTLNSLNLKSSFWQNHSNEIFEIIGLGRSNQKIRQLYSQLLYEDIWGQNILQIRNQINLNGSKWWRFLISDYRKAVSEFKTFFNSQPPKNKRERLNIISDIIKVQSQYAKLNSKTDIIMEIFNEGDHNSIIDWESILISARWYNDFVKQNIDSEFFSNIIQFMSNSDSILEVIELNKTTSELFIQFENSISKLFNFLQFENYNFIYDFSFQEFDSHIKNLKDFSSLRDLTKFNVIYEEFKSEGLSFIIESILNDQVEIENLKSTFDLTWYQGLLNHAFSTRNELKNFDRNSHEFNINKFRDLDKAIFDLNKLRLAFYHWDHIPNFSIGSGQTGILKREMNKKRRILPIRKLISEAGNAIQSIKPVFMMSPLSIATFLSPGSINFDLVIFDEASQIKPVDAFGGLLRAKQAVVVGDSKQLPPTNFFESNLQDNSDIDEDTVSISADMESILNLFVAQNASEKMLKWHYRSKHDSLIAVSNYEFYDNKLVVFPTPSDSIDSKGLIFNHIINSFYDRGNTSTNPLEAKYVASKVMQHAKESPHLTLGVVAFSTSQRDAIQFQLELMRRKDVSCEEFFFGNKEEPFFIKNLENVQGDERDVIFISIGYGKTADGGYLSHNFGPLNKDGGERRLNVLISRAKRTCEVFANFTADDIDLNRSKQRGVVALKRFLQYAQNRRLDVASVSSLEAESVFEEQVIESLTRLGYSVEAQVGVSYFRIDIAVKDSDKPGRYILGIECDGAKYHSSLSARDRDRLRQEVLEGLGWRIHRIWSTEWFREPERELTRLIESIEKAKIHWASIDDNSSPIGVKSDTTQPLLIEREKTLEESLDQAFTKYSKSNSEIILFGNNLYELSSADLEPYILDIIKTEGPIHKEIIFHRIVELSGVGRIGSRIKKTLNRSLQYALRKNNIKVSNNFYYFEDLYIIPRNRSELSQLERSYEFISEMEIFEGLKLVISNSFSITIDLAITKVYNFFGIARVTQGYLDHGRLIIKKLLKEKRLILNTSNEIELNEVK